MKSIIVFDFDGVMVDTFNIIYRLFHKWCPEMSEDDTRSLFEKNIFEALQDHSIIKSFFDFYKLRKELKKYTPQLFELPPIMGIAPILARVSKKYPLMIISSSFTDLIEKYLKQHNLFDYFNCILGADKEKKKEIKIKQIIDEHGISTDQIVFITDTLGDIKEMNQVGVKSIAVTWGFHSYKTLKKGNPFAIVNTTQDLENCLNTFFLKTKNTPD